jgi:hypothetical protein
LISSLFGSSFIGSVFKITFYIEVKSVVKECRSFSSGHITCFHHQRQKVSWAAHETGPGQTSMVFHGCREKWIWS